MKSAPLGTARDGDSIGEFRDAATTPCIGTALDVVAPALHPAKYERCLRSFNLIAAIGDDPLDASDACLADADQSLWLIDVSKAGFVRELSRVFADLLAERRRRNRDAAGSLARARLGTAIE